MVQSKHSELSNMQEKVIEMAFLGQFQGRWVVIKSEHNIWSCRDIVEDHLHARFVKFYGR